MIEGAANRMQLMLGIDIFDVRGPVLRLRHVELLKNRMAVDMEVTGNGVVYKLISTALTDNKRAGVGVHTVTEDNCTATSAS